MIGTRLGSYEITAKLGVGGMGEVYRATDTKLRREVAIKVLPGAFTEDRERLARFEREAQLLAQLHHPNIASIFGLEESEGTRALVMELVDGPTLADRLASGALPLEESLAIARQIAEALEEAHAKGIIHRDLKPQNVKAPVQGKVKVLDFGLAKAMDPVGSESGAPSASQLAASPTLTIGATMQGVILGTAAYMAPEQAKGFALDKRADIWAFGVVLYEMLTGASLFAGDSVGDTLAAVIRAEIDFDRLPAETPSAIRRLLRHCLQRNPKSRLHDIADARIVLDEVAGGSVELESSAQAVPRRSALAWIVASGALALGLAGGLLLGRYGATPSATGDTPGFHGVLEVSAPDKTDFVSGLAISADGLQLAFVARGEDGRTRLWVRALDGTEARELPGTVDARYPFWAPDGRRIGFFAQNRLKATDLLGGLPRSIAETGLTEDARGGAWSADDRIVFTPTFTGGIFTVSATGGPATPATELQDEGDSGTQRFPSFLPDGKRFVFYASTGTGVEPGWVCLGRLGSTTSKRLGPASSTAVFAEPGFLIYVRGDSLVAHELDLEREELVGSPKPLGISLPGSTAVSGQRSLAVSRTGLLVYRVDKRNATRLVLADRRGEEIRSLTAEPDTWYYGPTFSPDGQRFAVSHYEPGSTSGGIWVHDLDRNLATRVTFDDTSDDTIAVWSPDGGEIAFSSARAEGTGIYRASSRGSGAPQAMVLNDDHFLNPSVWLDRPQRLIFADFDASGRASLWMQRLDGGEAPRRLGPEHNVEFLADLSPDGRWIVFQSDASRRLEIYLRRLDDTSGATTVRVSSDGGQQPRWGRTGRELFYLDDNGRLMSVPVTSLDPVKLGEPLPLFDARLEAASDRQYDVSSDGQTFLLNRSLVTGRVPISVLVGWRERLSENRAP